MTKPELQQLRGQSFSVWARKMKVLQGRKGRGKSYLGSVTLDGELMLSTKFSEDALLLVSIPLPSVQRRAGEAWLGREEAEVMVALVILIVCVMGIKYSPSTVGHCSDDTQSSSFCLFLSVAEQPHLWVWACLIRGTGVL